MLSNHFFVLENKDSEAETNPDEDYNILNSFKNQLNIFSPNKQEDSKIKEGPNINLKCFKKTYDTDEEKIYITKKIRTKKKTELCKNWEFFHDCFFKNECSFAHGMEELRFDSHISGSKNKLCKSFQEKGYCIFGKRCNFRHIVKEKRIFTYQYILEKTCNQILSELNKKDNNETMLKIIQIIIIKLLVLNIV